VYQYTTDTTAAAAAALQVTSLGGRRAFVVSGGFEAWRAEGLKVRSNGSYEKSVLDAFGEVGPGACCSPHHPPSFLESNGIL